jgi:hypothetical protein
MAGSGKGLAEPRASQCFNATGALARAVRYLQHGTTDSIVGDFKHNGAMDKRFVTFRVQPRLSHSLTGGDSQPIKTYLQEGGLIPREM